MSCSSGAMDALRKGGLVVVLYCAAHAHGGASEGAGLLCWIPY